MTDVYRYAKMNGIVVSKEQDTWHIVGYHSQTGFKYLPKEKRIGKKDETAIRNIDNFLAGLST